MKKKTAAALAAALTVLIALTAAFGGCGGEGCLGCLGCVTEPGQEVDIPESTEQLAEGSDEPTAEPETPAPTETPAPAFVSMRSDAAMLRVNSRGTYGVASDGSVRFTGRAVSGQNLIYDWDDLVSIAVNEDTTAALLRNGTVRLTGSQEQKFSEALKWTGLADIAMGDEHLIGLKTDGTLLACGNKTGGRCFVGDWQGVKKAVAAGSYTAALTENGILTTLGARFAEIVNAKPAADIEAASDCLVVLYTDGTAARIPVSAATGMGGGSDESRNTGSEGGRSSAGSGDGRSSSGSGDGRSSDGSKADSQSGGTYDLGWQGIVKVFAAKGAAFGVDASGKLYTTSSLVEAGLEDVYCAAASEKHAVVLFGDGTCRAYGDNTHLQGRVDNWRLLPYVTEDGLLLGLRSGMYIGGDRVATGLETVWTEPATGVKTDVTCMLLGDVNGDGMIDYKDAASVRAHIAGEIKLEGLFLRAANAVRDGAKPDSVDGLDLERIQAEADGRRDGVDQYAKTDLYTDKLAAAKRKNADALGYIIIPNTNISYPIMYDFNWYYNDHDIDRNEIVRGSIYFYWSGPSGNTVITGHNSRTSGTMFHQLHKVQDNKNALKTYRNRVWPINTYGVTGYWEVWALYEEPSFSDASKSSQYYNTCFPGKYDSMSDAEKQAWIDYQLQRSELSFTPNVTIKDRFMTLLTCGDSHADSAGGARLYVFLRWVGED